MDTNSIDKKLYRIFILIIGIVLGCFIIIGITKINVNAEKVIAGLFSKTGSSLSDLELKFLYKRITERESSMQWFTKNKINIDSLLHPKKILLGAHDNECNENFTCLYRLEDDLKTKFPLVQIYVAWGGKQVHRFPQERVMNILNMGSLPVITWEPWLNEFDPAEFPEVDPFKDRNKKGLADIAKGFYDSYIIEWARDLKASKYPVFLRLGHEMNDPYRYAWGPQNGNTADDFIKAWQHVYSVFKKIEVKNVIWLWSPHLSYQDYEEYYPGDKYVDYLAVNILNYGTATPQTQWYEFDQIFKPHYDKLVKYKKPIMIAELGTLEYGGNKAEWMRATFDSLPQKYPAVKSVLFFHVSYDNDMVGVFSWYFINDKNCVDAISNSISKWNEPK